MELTPRTKTLEEIFLSLTSEERTEMGKALHAELQKARRRHDLLICLAVPVVVYLWAGAEAPNGADELANAYSALCSRCPF